jgi:hypothetical protein
MSPTAVLSLHTHDYVLYGNVIPTYIIMSSTAVLNLHIPNGIMVAQTFCDIFIYEKKTSDINI